MLTVLIVSQIISWIVILGLGIALLALARQVGVLHVRVAPAGALLVTESGIFTPADATRLERSGAKAMRVGDSLMRQADVEAAPRFLLAG